MQWPFTRLIQESIKYYTDNAITFSFKFDVIDKSRL